MQSDSKFEAFVRQPGIATLDRISDPSASVNDATELGNTTPVRDSTGFTAPLEADEDIDQIAEQFLADFDQDRIRRALRQALLENE